MDTRMAGRSHILAILDGSAISEADAHDVLCERGLREVYYASLLIHQTQIGQTNCLIVSGFDRRPWACFEIQKTFDGKLCWSLQALAMMQSKHS